jgi:hypothetical protein
LGLVDEHFLISTWHQRRRNYRRHRCSQWRDSRVCDGTGRAESNTNTYGDLNAYTYGNIDADRNAHGYTHTPAFSDANT